MSNKLKIISLDLSQYLWKPRHRCQWSSWTTLRSWWDGVQSAQNLCADTC